MDGCGLRCMKYLLFVFNFIIWLGGAGILVLGVILYAGLQTWIPIDELVTLLNEDNNRILEYSAYILFAAGSIIFFVTFCGCCGAITESQGLLGLYSSVLLIIFFGQIAAGILTFIYSGDIENSMEDGFRLIYGNGTHADKLTKAWRLAEASLGCCGYRGGPDYDDAPLAEDGYVHSLLYKHSDLYPEFPDFPESCCVGASHPEYKAENPEACRESWDTDSTRNNDTATYHGQGCRTIVANLIDEYINWIRAGAIGLAVP